MHSFQRMLYDGTDVSIYMDCTNLYSLSETVEIAPDFVLSKNGQWQHSRPAFRFMEKCSISVISIKCHCLAVYHIKKNCSFEHQHYHIIFVSTTFIIIMSLCQDITFVSTCHYHGHNHYYL